VRLCVLEYMCLFCSFFGCYINNIFYLNYIFICFDRSRQTDMFIILVNNTSDSFQCCYEQRVGELNVLQVEEVSAMHCFVDYLTSEMHRRVEHSEVIWFDSVTCDGQLKWQNELNEHNR